MSRRIVVVSDTHGNRNLLQGVMDLHYPFDIIVHCGDGLSDICSADIPEKCTVIKVSGNTDKYSGCDYDDILTEIIDEKTVMIAHGHQFNVKGGLSNLIYEANNLAADVVMFGHTHVCLLRRGTPILFNPGSLSDGNYGIIDIHDGEWLFEHRKLKR